MYSDSNSPFDEALSRPFLDEPIKKKWRLAKPATWFCRSNTSSKKTMNHPLANYDDEADCESISFGSDDDSNHEDAPLLLPTDKGGSDKSSPTCTRISMSSTTSSTSPTSCSAISSASTSSTGTCTALSPIQDLEDGSPLCEKFEAHHETLDLDLAIMHEREVELGEVAGSMRQIRDIQLDLSLVVDSQSSEVERLSLLSIESFQKANSGMEHLVQAVKHQQDNKSRAYSFMASLVIVLVVCYVIGSFFTEDATETTPPPGDAHGAPQFLIPLITP